MDNQVNSNTSVVRSKTVNIVFGLKLFEPTAESYPEFSYPELLKARESEERRKRKYVPDNDGIQKVNGTLDTLDEDVSKIAQQMELKYGGGSSYSTNSKKVKRHQHDDTDVGAGYDDNDSFIDNTDAYDELIPTGVETVNGGFYVNSGPLEFKQLPNFERPGDEEIIVRSNKRNNNDLSESSDKNDPVRNGPTVSSTESSSLTLPASKNDILQNNVLKGGQASSQSQTRLNVPESIHPTGTTNVNVKSVMVADELVCPTGMSNKALPVRDTNGSVPNHVRLPEAVTNTTLHEKENVCGKKDNKDPGVERVASNENSTDGSQQTSQSELYSSDDNAVEGESEHPIPNGLSPKVLDLIECIKNWSKYSKTFWNTITKEHLINMDALVRKLSAQSRSKVYSYLAYFLPITKSTLTRKCKEIVTQSIEQRLKEKFDILKKETEIQVARQLRQFNSSGSARVDKWNMQPKARTFQWDQDFLKFVTNVIDIHKELCMVLKKRNITYEEQLNQYLVSDIMPLWPSNFLKIDALKHVISFDKYAASLKKQVKDIDLHVKNKVDILPSCNIIQEENGLSIGRRDKDLCPVATVPDPKINHANLNKTGEININNGIVKPSKLSKEKFGKVKSKTVQQLMYDSDSDCTVVIPPVENTVDAVTTNDKINTQSDKRECFSKITEPAKTDMFGINESKPTSSINDIHPTFEVWENTMKELKELQELQQVRTPPSRAYSPNSAPGSQPPDPAVESDTGKKFAGFQDAFQKHLSDPSYNFIEDPSNPENMDNYSVTNQESSSHIAPAQLNKQSLQNCARIMPEISSITGVMEHLMLFPNLMFDCGVGNIHPNSHSAGSSNQL